MRRDQQRDERGNTGERSGDRTAKPAAGAPDQDEADEADSRAGELCLTACEILDIGWKFEEFCPGSAGACATLTPCA